MGPRVSTVNHIVRIPNVTLGPLVKQGYFPGRTFQGLREPRTKARPLGKINPLLYTTIECKLKENRSKGALW